MKLCNLLTMFFVGVVCVPVDYSMAQRGLQSQVVDLPQYTYSISFRSGPFGFSAQQSYRKTTAGEETVSFNFYASKAFVRVLRNRTEVLNVNTLYNLSVTSHDLSPNSLLYQQLKGCIQTAQAVTAGAQILDEGNRETIPQFSLEMTFSARGFRAENPGEAVVDLAKVDKFLSLNCSVMRVR